MINEQTLADELITCGEGILRPTRRVIIIGLVSRADLNGLEAVILPVANRRDGASGQDGFRLPVRATLSNESILVRLRNLKAAKTLAFLGADGLYACLFQLDPSAALIGRLVCQPWRLQLSRLLANPEWQAIHLPLPALCRASAWDAAMLRLERMPREARMSCMDWLEGVEAEARTGSPASGEASYPESVEHLADAGDTLGVLRWLDDDGGYVNARAARETRTHGYTLLMIAAEVGAMPLAEALLQRKADPNLRSRTETRFTALMIAAEGSRPEMVRLLLKAGADPTLRSGQDEDGDTALQMAEKANFEDTDAAAKEQVIKTLYGAALIGPPRQELTSAPFVLLTPKKKGSASRPDEWGSQEAPLVLALQHHAPARLVRLLVQHCPQAKGSPSVGLAVGASASPDVLAILCAANPDDLSEPDEMGLTPLHHAALARDPGALRVLLDAAPGSFAQDSPGGSPLHLLARGPKAEGKRLQRAENGQTTDAAAIEACEVLLAAYSDADALRATLLQLENFKDAIEAGITVKRTPLHLACWYHAPPGVVLRLLAACPAAASQRDSEGALPCHSIAGTHATEEMAAPLEALLAAHPPTPEWSLLDLLRLGSAPGAEAAALARLAAHEHEARQMDPVPPMPQWDHAGSRHDQRRRAYRRYPLHYAAESAAPHAVVSELLRLCPEAVRKQSPIGQYPLHLATRAAASLFHAVYGMTLRRPAPAEALCAAAADCVDVLLDAWPGAATACDKIDVPPGASTREQRDAYGWWPLHTALAFHAPEAVLERLRACTPTDAFGNPTRPNPGRRGATKSNITDVRRLRSRDNGARAHQLRFLCKGAEGAPSHLEWRDRDHWGITNRDGRMELSVVTSVDPSTENVRSLEHDRDDPDSSGQEEDSDDY